MITKPLRMIFNPLSSGLKIMHRRKCDHRRSAYQPGFHREEPKMRAFAHSLTVIGLLALAVQAPPAAAVSLTIGNGWTADDPSGRVTSFGAVTGTGTSSDAFTFTINLSSAVEVSTTINFVNDGAEPSQTYFNVTFNGTNTGIPDWKAMSIVIHDEATDVDFTEVGDHPAWAHLHRKSWNPGGAFVCPDGQCDYFPGVDKMRLVLNPSLATGNTATGSILRLHDKHEAGGDANPMKFNLTFTPTAVPIPGALILFGSGLVGLIGVARRRHRATQ